MSATLISRSPDLLRLQNEGFALQIVQGAGVHLLVHDVPYVNSKGEVLENGTLITPLVLNADVTVSPVANHQTWFIGQHPCNADGSEISGIKHGGQVDLGDKVVANYSFSAKLRRGASYSDYHAKMSQYIDIIIAPARSLKPDVKVKTFRTIADDNPASVFKYVDTASSRAGIGAIAQKLIVPKIAIVGLGGTGSYILDLVAKTHVQEIHLFDGDVFSQHNAFRAPGAPAIEELTNPPKAEYFAAIYSRMRRGILAHPHDITAENVGELTAYSFVFIAIDRPGVRKLIVDALQASCISFIDVGMDVQTFRQESLRGQCRITLSTATKHDHLVDRLPFENANIPGVYPSNVQVADLNALNAALAVIKWKKQCGFYLDQMREHHSVYTINAHGLSKDVCQ